MRRGRSTRLWGWRFGILVLEQVCGVRLLLLLWMGWVDGWIGGWGIGGVFRGSGKMAGEVRGFLSEGRLGRKGGE